LRESILGKAQERGLATVMLHQLRDYAIDKHKTVDEKPYGGGPGMLLKCEPIFRAVEDIQAKASPKGKVIYLTPSAKVLTQAKAQELAKEERLVLLCGHYEGVDERVREHLVDEELSIGDYVLTNGAVAALVVIDAVVRLLPGVVGNEASTAQESFSQGLLEGPQYTRPENFMGWRVPEILLSGNHAQIAAWYEAEARKRTEKIRPDLLKDKQ
jgi:tRNA (guanine37-N1)-methyltransferase